MSYSDEELLMIQDACILEVQTWKPYSIFSWPLDGLFCFPWQYQVHCAIVDAWNDEDRQTDCQYFHLKWLSNTENLVRVLQG